MKLDLSSDKPVITILVLVVTLIVVVVGGVVTVTNPQSLSFHQYVQDVAFMAGAIGLGAGIGRGIDSASSPSPGHPPVREMTAEELDTP